MTTPFEDGKQKGQWTQEQVRRAGFPSAQACLEHQERVYQEELEHLPALRAKTLKWLNAMLNI